MAKTVKTASPIFCPYLRQKRQMPNSNFFFCFGVLDLIGTHSEQFVFMFFFSLKQQNLVAKMAIFFLFWGSEPNRDTFWTFFYNFFIYSPQTSKTAKSGGKNGKKCFFCFGVLDIEFDVIFNIQQFFNKTQT